MQGVAEWKATLHSVNDMKVEELQQDLAKIEAKGWPLSPFLSILISMLRKGPKSPADSRRRRQREAGMQGVAE